MTSVFPTTPINICSLLSFGILFVLIIPLELHWDNRNETRGILPPSHTLHLHNLTRAARRSFESRPPFIHLIFPGQVLSWVVALSTELLPKAERHLPLQNHLSPACLPRAPCSLLCSHFPRAEQQQAAQHCCHAALIARTDNFRGAWSVSYQLHRAKI